MKLRTDDLESPIGTITLVATADGLCALDFADCRTPMLSLLGARYGHLEPERSPDPNGYTSRVRAYLGGELGALDDVAVDLGGTPFQRSVWSALRLVPAGATVSYGGLASSLGRPSAVRAVGLANARNPVCLVIPCHRVIGADGSLTGYAGGLERKRWLLEHEGRHASGTAGAITAR